MKFFQGEQLFFDERVLRFATIVWFFLKIQDATRWHFHVHMCTNKLYLRYHIYRYLLRFLCHRESLLLRTQKRIFFYYFGSLSFLSSSSLDAQLSNAIRTIPIEEPINKPTINPIQNIFISPFIFYFIITYSFGKVLYFAKNKQLQSSISNPDFYPKEKGEDIKRPCKYRNWLKEEIKKEKAIHNQDGFYSLFQVKYAQKNKTSNPSVTYLKNKMDLLSITSPSKNIIKNY